jgi:hypothetical protein
MSVLASSDPQSASDWIKLVLILGLGFALPFVFLLKRGLGRLRNERDERYKRVARLPEEYRPWSGRPALLMAAFLPLVAAAIVGGLISEAAANIFPGIVAIPMLAIGAYKLVVHRRRIIESVRRGAPTMDHDELATLVGDLEGVYGRTDMGSLRALLTDRSR